MSDPRPDHPSRRHHPLAGNALRTRADLQRAARDLFTPLRPYFSPGGAGARPGVTGAHFPDRDAALEGFARPLWGLAPLVAGGGEFADLPLLRRGLASGTDPAHEEFWGFPTDGQQTLVESAALGFALALAPEQFWTPLPPAARENLVRWLTRLNPLRSGDSNWLFFKVMVNLGLRRVGAEHDRAGVEANLRRLDDFYLGGGWYSDGPRWQRDYYIPFAMHFYGLIYAVLAGKDDPGRAGRYRQRAAEFAPDFLGWFAAGGAALPFGRSLTYRFAQGAFWGALAFADVEALPWGVLKGLALRHLRWWATRPIWTESGVLSIGYAYPNLLVAEPYNSPASPYWAMKFFLPLALPESHPFWRAEEAPLPATRDRVTVSVQPHAGMVVCRDAARDHVVALASGQFAPWLTRHAAEKYAKFAYSTRFGFGVPGGQTDCVPDNMLLFSEEGRYFRGRAETLESRVEGRTLISRWQPWPDVEIATWLAPAFPWHVRVHRVHTGRRLFTVEGGFALDSGGEHFSKVDTLLQPGAARLQTAVGGFSGLRDLLGRPGGATPREGAATGVQPNTNLLFPSSMVPFLRAELAPGEHWLACAVLGLPKSELGSADTDADADAWAQPLPDARVVCAALPADFPG